MDYQKIINTCKTKADFCRALGIKPAGANYKKVDKIIKDNNLNIDHFTHEP